LFMATYIKKSHVKCMAHWDQIQKCKVILWWMCFHYKIFKLNTVFQTIFFIILTAQCQHSTWDILILLSSPPSRSLSCVIKITTGHFTFCHVINFALNSFETPNNTVTSAKQSNSDKHFCMYKLNIIYMHLC